jgi:ketosteroid isomerase-like protein
VSRNQDLATIQRAYELWAQGDFEGLLALATPDVEWIPPSYTLEPGPLRGPEEVRRGINAYFEDFEEFLPEPEEIIDASRPDEYLVLVRTRARGRGSGAEVTIEVAHLITFREGRVSRVEIFADRADGLAAAGIERHAD